MAASRKNERKNTPARCWAAVAQAAMSWAAIQYSMSSHSPVIERLQNVATLSKVTGGVILVHLHHNQCQCSQHWDPLMINTLPKWLPSEAAVVIHSVKKGWIDGADVRDEHWIALGCSSTSRDKSVAESEHLR